MNLEVPVASPHQRTLLGSLHHTAHVDHEDWERQRDDEVEQRAAEQARRLAAMPIWQRLRVGLLVAVVLAVPAVLLAALLWNRSEGGAVAVVVAAALLVAGALVGVLFYPERFVRAYARASTADRSPTQSSSDSRSRSSSAARHHTTTSTR